MSCDTRVKDDTIHTHVMQTGQTAVGQIYLSTPVIAKFVVMQLRHLPQVRGIGKMSLDITHPHAWQRVVVHRADAIEVPLVIVDSVPLATAHATITHQLHTALQRWCGFEVTVEVAIVRVAPATQIHNA